MSALPNVLTMPVIAPKKRVVRSRCAHLEAEQLEAFMTAAKTHGVREWAMFIFAFSHGARVSEICDLRWADVNFHTKQVTIARKKHSLEQTQAFLKVKGSAVFDEDLIILDVNLPDRNRIAPSDVRSLLNGAKVLAITLGADDLADELLDSVGAVKVLDKMNLADQLILAILELAPAGTTQPN